MKILLSEAQNWCSASRSKVYADAREGLLSTEKDPHRGNKKVVDTAELERVAMEGYAIQKRIQRRLKKTVTDCI